MTATVSAPEASPADALPPSAELRLAVAFTGGVSLAVWMGGMAREMNLLLAASRTRRSTAVPKTGQGSRDEVVRKYAALLKILDMDCSIDILSGTSAGGINAVILGLACVQGFDLDGLRKLWFKQGSLADLLRDPADKQAASLLYGDKVLLQRLRDGLEDLVKSSAGTSIPDDDPTRVFVTTTLLTGQASTFTDEYDTLVPDTDHHGLFCFKAADLTPKNVPALALAARCSASFPVAFEPGFIPVGTEAGDSHPDMANFTGVKNSQFAADGGLLANRPLGPALQAIFDRTADREVRRVLAFVVPEVGSSKPPATDLTLAQAPSLPAALAADLGAVLEQTISSDLNAIAAHNQQVRARNDARQQLAVLGAQMEERLGKLFYDSYRARRADIIAVSASSSVLSQMPIESGADSRKVREAAYTTAAGRLTVELPGIGSYEDMNFAGREPLDEGRATVLALIRSAYRICSSQPDKTVLGELRRTASQAMPKRDEPTKANASAAEPAAELPQIRAAAETVAGNLLTADMSHQDGPEPWRKLATVVIGLRDLLPPARLAGEPPSNDALEDTSASDRKFISDLLCYLTKPIEGYSTEGDSADVAAARLFDLQVARYTLQPDGVLADQAAELVQMSSDTRTKLDTRKLASQKLTGLQLRHFGAFYKASWRANDWMWGRLDGSGWLVHVLLDPQRLYQLAVEAKDREAFKRDLRGKLETIAGDSPPPGIWEASAEMAFLDAATPPPPGTSLPKTAIWVAAGLQQFIAGEELSHVAEQIEVDRSNGADEGSADTFISAYRKITGAKDGFYPPVPPENAAEILNQCQVSAEMLTDEVGSQLFTQTVTRAAAVAMKMVDSGRVKPTFLRPLVATSRTITTLAYRVVRAGPVARCASIVGLFLIALGVLASTSVISWFSNAGPVSVLVGLFLLIVSAARPLMLALGVATVIAGALLALAGYTRPGRTCLFPWLKNTVVPYLASHPAQWMLLVVFVLLPPFWTSVTIAKALIRKSRRPAPRSSAPADQ